MPSEEVTYTGSKDPSIWGPQLWSVLHSLPESAKSLEKLKNCLQNLCLPCQACQSHYDEYLSENPASLIGTRTEAFDWIFNLHNEVNTRLGKPRVERKELIQRYRADAVGKEVISKVFA